jgi:hypothetical protein
MVRLPSRAGAPDQGPGSVLIVRVQTLDLAEHRPPYETRMVEIAVVVIVAVAALELAGRALAGLR